MLRSPPAVLLLAADPLQGDEPAPEDPAPVAPHPDPPAPLAVLLLTGLRPQVRAAQGVRRVPALHLRLVAHRHVEVLKTKMRYIRSI